MRSILAPALVLFHLVNDILGHAQLLVRGQKSLNLPAGLKPNGMLPREYFGHRETFVSACQRELERFICDDSLNLLMLRVRQVDLREHLE